MTSTVWVQLGRLGDILNILPMLWKDAQSGVKPKLMVAAEYASVLEGVSYVEPIIYNGPHYEIAKAVEQAKAIGGAVVRCLQVNGPEEETLHYTYEPAGLSGAATTSFNKESWRVAGRLREWDECYPLVFDQRSPEREAALLKACGVNKHRPIVLLCVSGNSSPFPYAPLLKRLVELRFDRKFRVLELPQAERIYDLLALYSARIAW